MVIELFKKQLHSFKIDLDEDTVNYISGILDDMDLSDHGQVREITEPFLIDTIIHDKDRNDFYKSLFSNETFQANRKPNDDSSLPIRLLEHHNKKVNALLFFFY